MAEFESIKTFFLNNYFISFIALLCVSFTLFYIIKHYILRILKLLTKNASTFWGQVIFAPRLLSQLSLIVPLIVFHMGVKVIEGIPEGLAVALERIALVSLVILTIQSISILLWKINVSSYYLSLAM